MIVLDTALIRNEILLEIKDIKIVEVPSEIIAKMN